MEQVINTGNPATDQEIAESIKQGMEAGGMNATITPAPGGGLCIRAIMPAAVQAAAAYAATAVATGSAPAMTMEPGAYELGGVEGYKLKEQALQGDFTGLRKLVASACASRDWEDSVFMIETVIGNALPGSLDGAVSGEPNARDLRLLRGAYAVHQAWLARGGQPADGVTPGQWQKVREWMTVAKGDLVAAAKAEPKDPTALAFLMRGCQIEDAAGMSEAFRAATERAPEFDEPYWLMVNQQSAKWGGSHQASLDVARAGVARARPGSDIHACVFRAHVLVWQYMKHFEGDEAGAAAYFAKADVRDELARTFDRWTASPYKPRRSSVPKLHWPAFWFFKAGDKARLKAALAGTSNIYSDAPWGMDGSSMTYTQAVQQAMGA